MLMQKAWTNSDPACTYIRTCTVQASDGRWIKSLALLWIFIWSEVHTLAKKPLLANKDREVGPTSECIEAPGENSSPLASRISNLFPVI